MIENWVKKLTAEFFGGAPFSVGDRVQHPGGRAVEIVAGQYWGSYGLSNFWYWREVRPDGTLGPIESGYGWELEHLRDALG